MTSLIVARLSPANNDITYCLTPTSSENNDIVCRCQSFHLKLITSLVVVVRLSPANIGIIYCLTGTAPENNEIVCFLSRLFA